MSQHIERLLVPRPSVPGGPPAVLEIVQGDITRVSADAIVNAANSALAGGGGVDGAIHRAAGPALMAELRALGRDCPTGSAVLTGPGLLAANGVRHVIHAVGPIWRNGRSGEPELLASAYATSCRLAEEAGDRTAAFPAISCGVYGYPLGAAAAIALRTVRDCLAAGSLSRATFVLFSGETFAAFAGALAALA